MRQLVVWSQDSQEAPTCTASSSTVAAGVQHRIEQQLAHIRVVIDSTP